MLSYHYITDVTSFVMQLATDTSGVSHIILLVHTNYNTPVYPQLTISLNYIDMHELICSDSNLQGSEPDKTLQSIADQT